MRATTNIAAALTLTALLTPGPAGSTRTVEPQAGPVRHLGSNPSGPTNTPATLQTAHAERYKMTKQPDRASRNRTPREALALTRIIAKHAGWNLHQRRCLEQLWHRESRFNPNAHNRRSGAGGIPQILGLDPRTPTADQIRRGLAYIDHRYGTPCTALRHHRHRGWY